MLPPYVGPNCLQRRFLHNIYWVQIYPPPFPPNSVTFIILFISLSRPTFHPSMTTIMGEVIMHISDLNRNIYWNTTQYNRPYILIFAPSLQKIVPPPQKILFAFYIFEKNYVQSLSDLYITITLTRYLNFSATPNVYYQIENNLTLYLKTC